MITNVVLYTNSQDQERCQKKKTEILLSAWLPFQKRENDCLQKRNCRFNFAHSFTFVLPEIFFSYSLGKCNHDILCSIQYSIMMLLRSFPVREYY